MIAAIALPLDLSTRAHDFVLERATTDDVALLVSLLTDGLDSESDSTHTSDAEATHHIALGEIVTDPAHDIVLVSNEDGLVVAAMHIVRVPSILRGGSARLIVETMHVRAGYRSQGIGSMMMRWAVRQAAPAAGATMLQLAAHVDSLDAQRFYERVGFAGSHRGFTFETSDPAALHALATATLARR